MCGNVLPTHSYMRTFSVCEYKQVLHLLTLTKLCNRFCYAVHFARIRCFKYLFVIIIVVLLDICSLYLFLLNLKYVRVCMYVCMDMKIFVSQRISQLFLYLFLSAISVSATILHSSFVGIFVVALYFYFVFSSRQSAKNHNLK